MQSIISVIKCHIVLMSRFRVKVLACLQSLSSSISLCMNPSTGFVCGCCTPSLSINSFPTPLILDAICNSFSGLSYLCGATQAWPVPALLSVYHNCTPVKNKLSSIDLPSCCLHSFGLFTLQYLAILPMPPCCGALAHAVLCLVHICI